MGNKLLNYKRAITWIKQHAVYSDAFLGIHERKKNILFFGAFFLIFLRILSYAWCSDDAYHAYVMSANLLAGKGFTPTPGIRVNVSTCPLWTLMVTLGMVYWNNPYAIGMILNLLFSGIALFMLFKFIYKRIDWFIVLLVATAVLCVSKTYLSYTTSGLENAQILMLSSFYLTVLFKNEYFSRKELFKIALLEGLIAFTRMDCALIFALTSVYVFLFRYKKDEKDSGNFSMNKFFQVIPIAVLGLLPFILWELFSLFYYGSFVPNTAIAKLNTGFPIEEYVVRGLWYFLLSGFFDIIVFLILLLFYAHFKIKQKHLKECTVLIGITTYYLYLLYIGGDFMLGRHLLSCFYICIFLLYSNNIKLSFKKICATSICLFLCFFISYGVLNSRIMKQYDFSKKLNQELYKSGWRGDIQKGRYPYTGLKVVLGDYVKSGEPISIQACPGEGIQWFLGNKAIYEHRLYDPLLSRLPAVHYDNWGVGFMVRKFPEGYAETLYYGENYIKDENLAFYYSKLKFIISGDLFRKERLREILRFYRGDYDNYIRQYIVENDLTTPTKYGNQ